MRSSEARRDLLAISLIGLSWCWLSACTQSAPVVAAAASTACVAAGAPLTAQQAREAAQWQAAVEQGPLYAAASASSPRAACELAHDADGQLMLSYRFRDGNALRASHNAAIEYDEQSAHFEQPPAEDPLALLARAERAAFGDGGCGIAWKPDEVGAVDGQPGVTETVYRGDVCNCQARVRRGAQGQVLALLLRSAC
jgi:hypothetical protein